MAQSASKKSKAQNILSDTEQLLARLEIEPSRHVLDIEKLTLFNKSITMTEVERNRSYYSQLQHWFRDGLSSNAIDELNSGSLQPVRKEVRKVMTSPYPVMIPFQPREEPLPEHILNDPNKLLEQHKGHWKQVRKHWIHHRLLYLKQYQPYVEFIESTGISPTDNQ